MACPFLSYRREVGEQSFDTERAYCTAAGEFVQPMRADICNDRYDLEHDEDCEIYLEHADDADEASGDADAATEDDGAADNSTSEVDES
ncbi:hypothetical protein [Halobacterium zhouii]|uniref:hypothetical protein n=1 Tax=Halobacterium zhouii TaxID=2902624 RepID=UPI001E303893|nr:hypothetical protein [Halobacterium zhouii]